MSSSAHPHSENAPSNYRPDVDGLRAVAILPVLFYHAGFRGFSGGFVGVDVFFVVSGFLITSLILPEAVQGKFSIANFYERRIRRIFPALFTVMLVALVGSYWLMWPLAFKDFGQSLVAATVFASNILFWLKFGYFDSPAETRPLLHTWSLAVEEQFYIVFPIYLLAVVRWFPRALKPVTVIIALLSFGLSLYGVAYAPTAAFYLAPSRTWELLLGAMLAMKMFPPLSSQALRTAFAAVGLVLISLAVALLTPHSPFPGAYALLPCLGTFLVIYAGMGGQNAVGRLLSTRWLVFIGLISYSLYLWHWPLIVFAELYRVRDITTSEAWVIIAVSVLLAIASWKFVEQPFRTRRIAASRRTLFLLAGATMLLTVALALPLHFTEGLPSRMSSEAQKLAKASGDCYRRREQCDTLMPEDVQTAKLCRLGATSSTAADFVLWGDSHGEFVLDAVSKAAANTNRTGLQITSEGCPPLLGVSRPDREYRHCPAFTNAAMTVIAEPQIRRVILVARWSLWSEGSRYRYENGNSIILRDAQTSDGRQNRDIVRDSLTRTLDALKALGKEVTIVAPIPEIGWDVPSVLALENWQQRKIHSAPSLSEFLDRNQFSLKLLQELQHRYNFELIYPHQVLCDQATCRAILDSQPLYCDDDHLSNFGKSLLVPAFEQTLRASH
ncbi:MAG TPA: acyltransferase family protein [Blastocatellia bacterium]|nr:acyltransferase family protein [Blastocatellia bacterium]